jgi:hypothetical protein
MWWDAPAPAGHQWVFLNNGYCEAGTLFKPPVGALYVGAPMDSSKVFVTCTDETLRERWYNASNGKWSWANHGKPYWYQNGKWVTAFADTRPISLGSGHVYLNASTTSSGSETDQILVQLWYSGTGWIWTSAGDPPTTMLTGNIDGDPVWPPNLYSLGKDGHIWDAQWDYNKSTFVWLDLGIPDGDSH